MMLRQFIIPSHYALLTTLIKYLVLRIVMCRKINILKMMMMNMTMIKMMIMMMSAMSISYINAEVNILYLLFNLLN